jgi:hypothetical protein
VFFICSGVSVFSALVFLVLGSGLEQSWAKDPDLNMEVDVSEDSFQPTNHIATNCHITEESMVNGNPDMENGLGFKRQTDDNQRPKKISQCVNGNSGYGEINLSFDINESLRTVQISDFITNSGVCLTGVSNIGEVNDDTPKRVCTTDSSETKKKINSKDHFAKSALKVNDTKREVTAL